MPFTVSNAWFSGSADVRTFAAPELIATKTRALLQRRKGRDLFDIWLALTELGIPGDEILSTFGPYRPAGITAASAEANLRAKLKDRAFRSDLDALVAERPAGYDLDDAAEIVIAEILSRI